MIVRRSEVRGYLVEDMREWTRNNDSGIELKGMEE